MASAYERRKDPEAVRRALLDCAASIAASEGLGAVTVAGVSLAAGVTKGALFHHFANKQALVNAMVDGLMQELDTALDTLIAADAVSRGSFTRAYVHAALTMDDTTTRIWSALIGALSTEPQVATQWHAWLAQRLRRHADTDADEILAVVRLAADGAWFTSLSATAAAEVLDLPAIRARLVAMTY
ncbi:TetR/AcrR family transcriptional regulator [Duganella sp. FT27W]|uniref:TetR/AcrR family transcriptional regulator n=1 Tax=Duganella sp. FT27W TaxID=2654636 RepID=UPI00128B434A|nr:TetR/AcrR family transcriptional regulator [Duganella sp. FT27W]MPQ57082.1 TetR family transcriptional regulator [Duganella sp. FT27W]